MHCKLFRFGVLLFIMFFIWSAPVQADLDNMKKQEGDVRSVDLSLGYRWLDAGSNPNRAAEYVYLEDSPTAQFNYIMHSGKQHFSLHAQVDNENDFNFTGSFDHKALFRLNARI